MVLHGLGFAHVSCYLIESLFNLWLMFWSTSEAFQCETGKLSGSRYPWLQKFTQIFIRAGFEHFLTFDAKPKQYEDWVSGMCKNATREGG